MLRDPAYKGTTCFGKTEVSQRQRVTRRFRMRGGVAKRNGANHERPRKDWIEIPVPAIISEETFAIAQELLTANNAGRFLWTRTQRLTPRLARGRAVYPFPPGSLPSGRRNAS